MLEIALEHMVALVDACRGDAGVCNPDDAMYRPQAVHIRPMRGAPPVPSHLEAPSRHPLIKATWRSAGPLAFDEVRADPQIGDLRHALLAIETQAMMIGRIDHAGAMLGIFCLDFTGAHRWTWRELAAIQDFRVRFLGPALFHSARDRTGCEAVLSPAERAVVRLAARGFTYGEIAQQLHKSVHTVDHQLRSARRKTGSRNLTDLVGRYVGHLTSETPP